jgi:alcohol/geraniol dehydrogenase (NADP+)
MPSYNAYAKGLKIGQKVGLGWFSHSCLSCHECLSGDHHLCSTAQGTIVARHGGFADRVRAQWTWVRPLPEGLDVAKAGPLLCGGVTVFAPLLIHDVPATARVGVIGIGGLGHMALQFANKWGCEVHAFTTSDSKEAEAKKLGAHFVHNTKNPDTLKKLARSLDIIISTINAPLDVSGLLDTLRRKGHLHNVGAVLKPLEVSAFSSGFRITSLRSLWSGDVTIRLLPWQVQKHTKETIPGPKFTSSTLGTSRWI